MAFEFLARVDPARASGVHLICAVPIEGTLAQEGECTVRSLGGERIDAGITFADRERDSAQSLARARDIAALSSLVGDVPDECRTVGDSQRCRWRLDAAKPGSRELGVLAVTSTIPHLQCVLPLTGGPRAARSCRMLAGKEGNLVGVSAPAIDAYEQVVLLSARAD